MEWKIDTELTIFDSLPDGFLQASGPELKDLLPGPSLIDLSGRDDRPLFVCTLLHGNEVTGLLAIQRVLEHHQSMPLPRRLLIFVGNISAAAEDVRTLDRQTDYNRVWPGTEFPDAPEADLMAEVTDYVSRQDPFASIDIHNNTGFNPHYACVNKLDADCLHLARLFSRTIVFFEKPTGVQSAALAKYCPAVTVECGISGDPAATSHAAEFVQSALHLHAFPENPPDPADLDIYRTFGVVKVPTALSFSFDGAPADIQFRSDIDHLNFSELDAGTVLATYSGEPHVRLAALPATNEPVEDYFQYRDQEVRLAQPAIPAMLTKSAQAVRQDSLCYFMHRVDLTGQKINR